VTARAHEPAAEAERRRRLAGVGYAAGAYLIWGLFPVYFHALAGAAPLEILCHRIVWSALFLAGLLSLRGRWAEVRAELSDRRILLRLTASALFISANWLVYIWAVNAGHVLEASLGYFVNPLVTVLLGVVFLREPLSGRQRLALALAATGVGLRVWGAHRFPAVALTLALTFGMYGLIRKRVRVSATSGLLAEVTVLAPVALAYLAWLGRAGQSHFLAAPRFTVLLAASGVVTAVPLLMFAVGVQRLRLSTVGLLQYLNPTVQLAIAVFAFGEPFGAADGWAFGLIWCSLAIYTTEAIAASRAAPRPAPEG
jgi:chloramphenicol-sensitive protein RarD